MAVGGKRPGAGRPRGTTKVKKVTDIAAMIVASMEGKPIEMHKPLPLPKNPADLPEPILAEHFTDPADFLRAVMNCTKLDHDARKDAAKALMPYVHVKKGEGGKKDAKDEAAKSAAKGRFGAAAAPKLVASNG